MILCYLYYCHAESINGSIGYIISIPTTRSRWICHPCAEGAPNQQAACWMSHPRPPPFQWGAARSAPTLITWPLGLLSCRQVGWAARLWLRGSCCWHEEWWDWSYQHRLDSCGCSCQWTHPWVRGNWGRRCWECLFFRDTWPERRSWSMSGHRSFWWGATSIICYFSE